MRNRKGLFVGSVTVAASIALAASASAQAPPPAPFMVPHRSQTFSGWRAAAETAA
jgi:hypothetical protein